MTAATPTQDASDTATLDLAAAEQFLYREARLADTNDYDAWEALWTDDGLYWVPAGGDDIDPDTQMSVIHDNRRRISTRIKQLKTGKRHAQTPKSRIARIVGNIEILGTEGIDTVVGATFLGMESRERGTVTWAGRVTYRLRLVDGEVRMAYKKVALVDNERALPSVAFLI